MSTEEKIQQFISETLVEDASVELNGDTSLFNGGILDSIALVSLIGFLEDEFSIKVQNEEVSMENFDTIRNIGAFVTGKS